MATLRSEGTSSGSTGALSTTVNASAGDAVVVVVHMKAGASQSVSSVSDPVGNTYTRAAVDYQSGVNSRCEIWYVLSSAGSITSVTVTPSSGTTYFSTDVTAWTPTTGNAFTIVTSAPGSATGNAASTTPAARTATFASAALVGVVVGGISYPSATGPTLNTGSGGTSSFTALTGTAGSAFYGAHAYRILSTPGTSTAYGPSWTLPSSVASGAVTIGIGETTSGGGGGGTTGVSYLVQADFSGTAFGGTPTWTDITAYVLTTGEGQPVNITFGKQDEFSTVNPSTCSMVLLNDDGRFTPGRAASPYYPNVVPGVRVRVSAVVNGATYHRFDGYIDSWQIHWTGPANAVAVSATDVFARYGLAQPLYSTMSETVLADAPLLYLPLTDPQGTTSPAMLAQPAGTSSEVVTSGAGSFTWQGGPGPVAEGTQGLFVNSAIPNISYIRVNGGITLATSNRHYFHVVWQAPPNGQAGGALFYVASTSDPHLPRFFAYYTTSGANTQFDLTTNDKLGNVTDTVANFINDGLPHDLVFEVINGASPKMYIDGTLAATSTDAISLTDFPAMFDVVSLLQVPSGFPSATGGGAAKYTTISHFSIYDRATSINLNDHYLAGATGFAGEPTGTHIARLLSYRTNLGYVVDTGTGVIGNLKTQGLSLQQALLDTAAAENGLVYIDAQGRVAFRQRSDGYSTIVAATLNAALQQVSSDVTFTIDTQQLANDVTVTSDSGAVRVQDTASQAIYGLRQLSQTLALNSNQDTMDAANWLLASRKDAKVRSSNLTVSLGNEPSLTTVQAVAGVDLWDRISLTNMPAAAPATAIGLWVQGRTEQIGVDTWTIAFNTAPVTLQPVIADDATYGAADGVYVAAW